MKTEERRLYEELSKRLDDFRTDVHERFANMNALFVEFQADISTRFNEFRSGTTVNADEFRSDIDMRVLWATVRSERHVR